MEKTNTNAAQTNETPTLNPSDHESRITAHAARIAAETADINTLVRRGRRANKRKTPAETAATPAPETTSVPAAPVEPATPAPVATPAPAVTYNADSLLAAFNGKKSILARVTELPAGNPNGYDITVTRYQIFGYNTGSASYIEPGKNGDSIPPVGFAVTRFRVNGYTGPKPFILIPIGHLIPLG